MALSLIKTNSIAASAVTGAKIAAGTVVASDIADGTVSTVKLADDAVTLAKMAAGTDGNVITYDASGNPAVVTTGTAAHVLTSNGTGAAPTFQAVVDNAAAMALALGG